MGKYRSFHGKTGTKIYYVWIQMKQRCLNKNNKSYERYGGRGIGVCERWLNFTNFLSDMGEPPTEKHSIDRIDNDGDYSPENCRWATPIEQQNNTRKNRFLELRGEIKTLAEWSRELNISPALIKDRLNTGWSMEDILADKKGTGGAE